MFIFLSNFSCSISSTVLQLPAIVLSFPGVITRSDSSFSWPPSLAFSSCKRLLRHLPQRATLPLLSFTTPHSERCPRIAFVFLPRELHSASCARSQTPLHPGRRRKAGEDHTCNEYSIMALVRGLPIGLSHRPMIQWLPSVPCRHRERILANPKLSYTAPRTSFPPRSTYR